MKLSPSLNHKIDYLIFADWVGYEQPLDLKEDNNGRSNFRPGSVTSNQMYGTQS